MEPEESSRADPLARPSAAVRAEAAAWVACLHGGSRTRALEAGFRRWLEADAAHRDAFELATEAWELGGGIPEGALSRMRHPGAAPRRRAGFAIAAASAAIAVAMGLWLMRAPDAIRTGVGEQRTLTLADGSRIYLNTGTYLVVEQDEHMRRVRLEAGEVLFEVAKDPRRPFVVTAGDKEILAIGTTFLVRRDADRLAVTLMEGKVQVDDGPSQGAIAQPEQVQVLSPGQRLTFTRDLQPRLDAPALAEVTAWQRGEVILDGTRLADAAAEMNRYSTVRLVVDALEADLRVSGVFRAGDSAQFAKAVGEIYRLEVVHREREIRISGARD